ncbi:hypothetical protein R6Q57_008109 [Mikania cordata]
MVTPDFRVAGLGFEALAYLLGHVTQLWGGLGHTPRGRLKSYLSCGSCGYPLNIASSNRRTSEIGSKYHKSIKKGSISFESIDLSRFTQLDEPSCFPVCLNHHGLKTKLLCRQCGVQIGYGYGYGDAHIMHDIESSTVPNSQYKQIVIKIRALQPLDTANQLSANEGR